jgi:glyoxylase-like metal-dependent hydrolase (beta-lactamase superfamily II)
MKTRRFRGSLLATCALVSLALLARTVLADAAAPAARGQFQAFKIGIYDAVALKDGGLQEPNDGKSFVVGQPTEAVAATLKGAGAPGDHFEFSIQPLLVHAGRYVLLFDTGAGTYFGKIAGWLPDSMAAAHESASSVTDIFITHAHGDHIGGLLTPSGTLAFPNATIHMSATEWQWLSGMTADAAKQVGIQNLTALVAALKPKVVPFSPAKELIPGIVRAVELKGHTPGHSGYLVGAGAASVLVFGDAMHSYIVSLQQPSWKIAFDTDQETSAASRVTLLSKSVALGQRLYAEHFPFPGIGKIVKDQDTYRWVPDAPH